MSFKSTVSICIPILNGAHLIPRALESCLRQTHANIEVVVVDDASTDSTPEVVGDFMKHDSRIKYYRNEKTLGLSQNFLRSFELASGEFVQHLGCDDWLDDNYAEEKVKIFLTYPDVGFVGGGISSYCYQSGTDTLRLVHSSLRKSGFLSTEYVFRNYYRENVLIGTFGMSRRSDILAEFMPTIPNSWGYDEYYRKGIIIDNICFLNFLVRYPRIYFTDKTSFRSLLHAKQASKAFGLQKGSIKDDVRFIHIGAKGIEYFYACKAPRYLFNFRIYKGAEIIAAILFGSIRGYARDLSLRECTYLFRDYSKREIICTILTAPLHIVFRGLKWCTRHLSKKYYESSVR